MTPPVVVDMFCGSGGESQGIEWSAEKAGIQIEMFAINHWQRAIETHQANFPDAEHICRDVADIHPPDLVPGGKIAVLWMSPECTNHSPARGDKPMDNQSRCSAFTLFDWINKLTVDRVIVENVTAFENWGPIDEETKRPIEGREGETFKAWLAMIRSFDYTVDYRKLYAADYGAPTTRRRLFVQAVRNGSGKSILWPEPSHARPGPNRVLTQELPRWIPAREIINWDLPSESIFSRRRPLAERTMQRIREGLVKFGGSEFLVCMEHGGRVVSANVPLPTITTARGGAIGVAQPFIVEYYGNGQARPISDPLPTVTTRDRFALVEPQQHDDEIDIRFRMLTPGELAAAQSFPREYVFLGTREEVVKQIGNAVCPVIAEALTASYMQELAGAVA